MPNAGVDERLHEPRCSHCAPADQESGIVQMGALDLFEFVNAGKDQARSNWTAGTVPEAVLEDHEVGNVQTCHAASLDHDLCECGHAMTS